MIQIFGNIEPPPGVSNWAFGKGGEVPGLIPFISAMVKLVIVIGGLFALFNLILAGYAFMSAGDDPKKITAAWGKIWQTLLGLLIMAGSFVLAVIFGWIIFQDPTFILNPKIYTP
jgi:hypothetical protein